MKKLIKLFVLLLFLCGSFCLTTISYAQENSEGEEPITMEIQPGTSITLLPGQQFNAAIKTLANNGEAVSYGTVDNNIQNFQRAEEIPAGANTRIISEDGSYPVYAWFDGGTLYYASQSETIYLNENSQQMFFNFNGIEELDLSDFDTSNVTNMGGVFAGCSSLEEINLSGWDFSKYNISSLMMNMTYGGLPSLKKLDMSNTKYGTTMNYAFGGLSTLEEIVLEGVDTSAVTDMGSMFNGDSKLIELNLGGRNTSNVNNMGGIFGGCSSLAEINLSGWDFRKAGSYTLMRKLYGADYYTNMPIKRINLTNAKFSGSMANAFEYLSLEEIKFDGIDTSNVTDMSNMFHSNWTNKIKNLDLSSFDTSNVTSMSSMFNGCAIEDLNMSGWDFRKAGSSNLLYNIFPSGTSYQDMRLKKLNLTNAKFSGSMYHAFFAAGMVSPTDEIILDGVDTTEVTKMDGMFRYQNLLTGLNLSSFDTSNVTDMSDMFHTCGNLTELDLSSWDITKVTNMNGMFGNCDNLEELNLSGWNFKNLGGNWSTNVKLNTDNELKVLDLTNAKFSGSMANAFYGLKISEEIKFDGIDTTNVTDMTNTFSNFNGIKDLDLSSFDTSNVTSMTYMFGGSNGLETINFDGWNTSNVTAMSAMFYGCSSLSELDLSNFDTRNVTNMGGMFGGCSSLAEINLSGWDFRKYNTASLMMNMTYGGLPSLKKLDMTNTKYGTTMSYAFGGLSDVEEIILEGADTSEVLNMSAMFNGDAKLTELNLSNFDTRNVTNMGTMFYNTPTLKTIYASDKFVTTNVTDNGGGMFYGTVSVVGGNGTKFDPNFIDKTYALIDKVGQTGYFTDKNAITVKFISSIDKSETTATFTKGQKLTPPSVGGYHVAGGYLDESMMQEIDLNKGVDSYSVVYVKYERNGSSGGGGGGGGGSSKPDTQKDEQGETPKNDASTGTTIKEPENTTGSNVQTGNQVDSQSTEQASEQSPQNDNSNTQDSSTSSQNNGKSYTQEFQQAYEFARENGITTMSTIQKADMNGKLTRIQMAKMLSQYAINILGKEPDVSKGVIDFKDVTYKMNKDYDNGVTLAYQLGIMGQNMPGNNFRPNDEVTRAEFTTALSRMVYGTSDGEYKGTGKYYIHHMKKLIEEGIITRDDPNMKELRGYVMIMLMRSAK